MVSSTRYEALPQEPRLPTSPSIPQKYARPQLLKELYLLLVTKVLFTLLAKVPGSPMGVPCGRG